MNFKVLILPDARLEIAETVQWYERQHPGLGKRFWHNVQQKLIALKHDPLWPRKWGRKEYRKVALKSFPYLIYYEVCGAVIRVHGVVHASRDPKLIIRRLL